MVALPLNGRLSSLPSLVQKATQRTMSPWPCRKGFLSSPCWRRCRQASVSKPGIHSIWPPTTDRRNSSVGGSANIMVDNGRLSPLGMITAVPCIGVPSLQLAAPALLEQLAPVWGPGHQAARLDTSFSAVAGRAASGQSAKRPVERKNRWPHELDEVATSIACNMPGQTKARLFAGSRAKDRGGFRSKSLAQTKRGARGRATRLTHWTVRPYIPGRNCSPPDPAVSQPRRGYSAKRGEPVE